MRVHLVTWPHGAGGDTRDVAQAVKVFLAEPGRDVVTAPIRGALSRPLRLLLSYHYYKDQNLDTLLSVFADLGVPLDVFADSGAWSAWSVGEPVDARAYVDWVHKWRHHFSAVSGPDVIGDAEATTKAIEAMRAEVTGLPVLPVFHVGEDWSYLEHWAAREDVDYLAFGGMVPYTRR